MRVAPSWLPLVVVLALALALAAGAAPTVHAASAPQRCASAKTKAAGTAAQRLLACDAAALAANASPDPACPATRHATLVTAFTHAESRGGCLTTGDATAIGGVLDDFVATTMSALGNPASDDARRCAAAKLKAAGKKASAKLACSAKGMTRGTGADPLCLAKAEAKFAQAFVAADTRYACAVEGDADAIETAHVDPLVAALVQALPWNADGVVVVNGPLTGVALFPPDNWWNRDVSNAPVAPTSDAVIDFIGRTTGLHPDFGTTFGIPYVVVEGTQPRLPVSFLYAGESDAGVPGGPAGYPIPEAAKTTAGFIEGGVAGGGSQGDRHLLLVDRDHLQLFELFATHYVGGKWTAGSGAFFDLTSNARRPDGWTSADAAGLAILPGLVRADEVFDVGEITHALRFTVRGTQGYIYPASHDATSGPGGDARPPLGLRVRLKGTFDVSGFVPPVQVILRAMQRYGMIIADNGSDWFVSGAPDSRWDDELMHDQFLGVTGDDFEVVQ